MITLIERGEVHAPDPRGVKSVLVLGDRIARLGDVDRAAVEALDEECEIIDAEGCIVAPGFIDPHEHLLGGSGEEGFSTQTPEFFVDEIVRGGITTVVGCLGVDTTMKTMAGLLAKAKALKEEGVNAFLWTGGYNVPPTSIMSSVREDIMFIEEVVGVGEIAIADRRGMEPTARDLVRIATDAHVGGSLAGKAGITHLHVGEGRRRLAVLREVLEDYDVEPEWFYATHIERSRALVREAVTMSKRGVAVDIDVVEGELAKWARLYLDEGGDPARLTISTDASVSAPRDLHAQLARAVCSGALPLEVALPLVTRNTARVLKLEEKGELAAGKIADIVILDRATLAIRDVLARGRVAMRDGETVARPRFLEKSRRTIVLRGGKTDDGA